MPKKSGTIVRVARDERPAAHSKFKAEYIQTAAKLAHHGLTDRAIADVLNVSRRTFQYWLIRHPKLKAALSIPKGEADARVEMALYQNAIGYDYDEEEVKIIDGKPVKVVVRKHMAGQTMAQLAWLHNRQRDHWRRNPENWEDQAALPPPEEAPDITADNARQMARRVALMLYEGTRQ